MNIEILEAVSEKLEVRFGCNKKTFFHQLWKALIFDPVLNHWFDPLFWSTNFFSEIYD